MEIGHVKKKSGRSVMLSVAHLPSSFSSADLRKLTEPHARVLKCWMAQPPGGVPLGFGYVEVPTAADVQAIMRGLRGVVLDGKPVSVTTLDTA
jgi:RNA recognition motif-containing protein